MNSILGSGILALPYAMFGLGYALFTFMLASVSGLAYFSIDSLVQAGEFTGKKSYMVIAELAMGKFGRIYAMLMLYLHTFAAQCSFMNIVKSQLPEALMAISRIGQTCISDQKLDELSFWQTWWTDGNIIFTLVLLVFVMPLSALRKIDFLGWTSAIAMFCMAAFTVIILVFKFIITCPFTKTIPQNTTSCFFDETTTTSDNSPEYTKFMTQIEAADNTTCVTQAFAPMTINAVKAITAMMFAFQCHSEMLPIYAELKNGTRKLMLKVSIISLAATGTMYFTVALFGYLTWRQSTLSDVLLMYSFTNPYNPWVVVARMCSLICVIFSAPLLHYPCRETLHNMIWGADSPFSWVKHLGIMAFNLTGVWICCLYVKSLGQIISYAGAVTGSSLIMVLPSLSYVMLSQDKNVEQTQYIIRRRLGCKILAGFGIIFIISSFSLVLWEDIKG